MALTSFACTKPLWAKFKRQNGTVLFSTVHGFDDDNYALVACEMGLMSIPLFLENVGNEVKFLGLIEKLPQDYIRNMGMYQ